MIDALFFEVSSPLAWGAFGLAWVICSAPPLVFPTYRRLADRERPGGGSFLVGLGFALSCVFFGTLAICGYWFLGVTRWWSWSVLTLWLAMGLWGWRRFLGERPRDRKPLGLSLVLVVAFLPWAAVVPLANSPSLSSDDLNHHLTLIRLWFGSGSLEAAKVNLFGFFPSLYSAVAAVFLPLFGAIGAKLTQLFAQASTGLLLFGTIAQITSKGAAGKDSARLAVALGTLAVWLLFLSPGYIEFANMAMPDRGVCLLVLAGLVIPLLQEQVSTGTAFALLGTCLAGAAAAKHSGVLVLVAAFPVLLLSLAMPGWRPKRKKILQALLASGLVTVAVLTPWYMRAYHSTGHWLYGAAFPQTTDSYELAQKEMVERVVVNDERFLAQDDLAASVVETLMGYNQTQRSSRTDPVFLILAPAGLLALARRRERLPTGYLGLSLILALYLVLNFFLGTIGFRRAIFPVYGGLLLWAVLGVWASLLTPPEGRLRLASVSGRTLLGLLCLALALSVIQAKIIGYIYDREKYDREFFSGQSGEKILERRLGPDFSSIKQLISPQDVLLAPLGWAPYLPGELVSPRLDKFQAAPRPIGSGKSLLIPQAHYPTKWAVPMTEQEATELGPLEAWLDRHGVTTAILLKPPNFDCGNCYSGRYELRYCGERYFLLQAKAAREAEDREAGSGSRFVRPGRAGASPP